MPYKFETEKKKIGKDRDRRRKITDEQRAEIKRLYGSISQRKLAGMFKVSRRLIQLYGDEDKLERNKELHKINGNYYQKDKQRVYMKRHRDYKKSIFVVTRIKSMREIQ